MNKFPDDNSNPEPLDDPFVANADGSGNISDRIDDLTPAELAASIDASPGLAQALAAVEPGDGLKEAVSAAVQRATQEAINQTPLTDEDQALDRQLVAALAPPALPEGLMPRVHVAMASAGSPSAEPDNQRNQQDHAPVVARIGPGAFPVWRIAAVVGFAAMIGAVLWALPDSTPEQKVAVNPVNPQADPVESVLIPETPDQGLEDSALFIIATTSNTALDLELAVIESNAFWSNPEQAFEDALLLESLAGSADTEWSVF